MPFNEALFWFGIAALGVGPFFVFEGGMKKAYGIGLTVVGVLACAYSVYRHYHPEALPQIPFWIIIWVLTWVLLGYDVYLCRFRRLRSTIEKSKEPSQLVIHSANYRAWGGGGDTYDVTEFLRTIISGDSLVFTIENHNFVVGNHNFVPIDPLSGKVKRLRVTYSYKGDAASTIERSEHERLVLPEDSAVQRLTDELTRTKQQTTEHIAINKQLEVELFKCRQIRDLALADARTAKEHIAEHNTPDITGEILHARRPMRISPYKGHEQSMLLLKLRVSTRTESATIRRTNLTVESNGEKYEGKQQPIEIGPVAFHYQFSQSREEKPFDLVDKVAKEPLRFAVGTEGWLQFLVDGLPNAVGIADLYLTITDDLGGEHLISAKSFSID